MSKEVMDSFYYDGGIYPSLPWVWVRLTGYEGRNRFFDKMEGITHRYLKSGLDKRGLEGRNRFFGMAERFKTDESGSEQSCLV